MDLISKLADQSILGLLLAIALAAIFFLYRENKDLQEKRVQEATQIRDDMAEPLKVIREYVVLTYDKLKTEKEHKNESH